MPHKRSRAGKARVHLKPSLELWREEHLGTPLSGQLLPSRARAAVLEMAIVHGAWLTGPPQLCRGGLRVCPAGAAGHSFVLSGTRWNGWCSITQTHACLEARPWGVPSGVPAPGCLGRCAGISDAHRGGQPLHQVLYTGPQRSPVGPRVPAPPAAIVLCSGATSEMTSHYPEQRGPQRMRCLVQELSSVPVL